MQQEPLQSDWHFLKPLNRIEDVKEYQDLAYLDTVEVEDPEREGYTFTGWTLEGENSKLNDKTFTMGTKDSTLTATWVANTYTYIVKHYKLR